MTKKHFCLVYQGGLANVFEERPGRSPKGNGDPSKRVRILQSDFRAAWCNEAGDIKSSLWRFEGFHNAPFHDSFSRAFVLNPNED